MKLTDTIANSLIQWCCRRADQAGLSSAQVDSAPAIPSVYILVDPSGTKPIYVGNSSMVRNRVLAHSNNPDMVEAGWEFDIKYLVPGIESLDLRLEIEAHLILALRPPMNKALLLNTRGRRLSEIRWKRKHASHTKARRGVAA